MRRVRFVLLVMIMVLAAGCASPDPAATARRPAGHDMASLQALRAGLTRPGGPPYYLALGDSLSVGLQPGPSGADAPTRQGYPDRIARALRPVLPGLRLVKLGCSGETTSTMIAGGVCRYPAGSQLAQAVAFLRAHRGRVALITLDIGANDPNNCVTRGRLAHVFSCLARRVTGAERNLDLILSRIRAVSGRRVLVVGMTYYVPELALWNDGSVNRRLAILLTGIAAVVNRLLAKRYLHHGARVADVFAAFGSQDFGRALGAPGHIRPVWPAPPNVIRICALTWMCAPAPRGPNEHPDAAGYRVIARAFLNAIAVSRAR